VRPRSSAGLDPGAAGHLAGLVPGFGWACRRLLGRLLGRERRRVSHRLPGERLERVDPLPVGAGHGQHRPVGGEDPPARRQRPLLEAECAARRPERREEELRGPPQPPSADVRGEPHAPMEDELAEVRGLKREGEVDLQGRHRTVDHAPGRNAGRAGWRREARRARLRGMGGRANRSDLGREARQADRRRQRLVLPDEAGRRVSRSVGGVQQLVHALVGLGPPADHVALDRGEGLRVGRRRLAGPTHPRLRRGEGREQQRGGEAGGGHPSDTVVHRPTPLARTIRARSRRGRPAGVGARTGAPSGGAG
jgi:hypothetical protein